SPRDLVNAAKIFINFFAVLRRLFPVVPGVLFIQDMPKLMLYAIRAPEVLEESIPLISSHQVLGDFRFIFQLVVQLIKHALRFAARVGLREMQTIRAELLFKLREQSEGACEISPAAR